MPSPSPSTTASPYPSVAAAPPRHTVHHSVRSRSAFTPELLPQACAVAGYVCVAASAHPKSNPAPRRQRGASTAPALRQRGVSAA
eukprot:CAMPEP_0184530732 /NCGR_PEP_ID=MMETSP0198_2-20121128/13124_1 /TAXON_ID=1112570 /ORGANISM="Thraustochytrium sp., Strain LLF1b" /LENGTH=84 /DNA_ID=CAMNT_0026922949 /DNA_START=514 /DNA_END=768 /DNA_ORIENTATION=-